MKRILSIILALACLSAFAFAIPASAENPTVAYVSDSGNDGNDGLSAAAPKKTLQQAYNVLNGGVASTLTTTGTIVVVGTLTFSSWQLPKGAVTITGNDSNAVFVHGRGSSGILLNGDLTFDNIKVKNSTAVWSPFQAGGYKLEFTSTVTCPSVSDDLSNISSTDLNKQYPSVMGGYKAKTFEKGIHIIINGGTFGDVDGIYYGGSNADKVKGKSEIVIGENVTVIRRVSGILNDTNGSAQMSDLDITVKNGANIGSIILDKAGYTGNLNLNVSGNVTIGSISASAEVIPDQKTFTADFELFKNCTDELESALVEEGFKLIPRIDLAPVFIGTQEANTGSTDSIRFSAVIDTLEYKAVGFHITAAYEGGSKEFNLACQNVYTALVSVSGGSAIEVKAEDYYASYVYALVIKGVPQALGEITFTVTPYAEKGGNTINGNSYTVVYNAGEFVSCAVVQAAN